MLKKILFLHSFNKKKKKHGSMICSANIKWWLFILNNDNVTDLGIISNSLGGFYHISSELFRGEGIVWNYQF